MLNIWKRKITNIFFNDNAGYLEERKRISAKYIHGTGIEIGALHSPLDVPDDARVKYVDRMPVNELLQQYPELASFKLVDVDIVADGESLDSIPDASQDFCIANHFIEHCENPIKAIENILRVLKTGGIVYISIPDKRFSFDMDREVTSFEHLENDYFNGPEKSKRDHYREWVTLVNKVDAADRVEENIDTLIEKKYSIHFHVWTQAEAIDLMLKMQARFAFEILLVYRNENEIIFILQKNNGS